MPAMKCHRRLDRCPAALRCTPGRTGHAVARQVLIAAVLAPLLLLVGCKSRGSDKPSRARGPVAPISNTDPCAMRLHDLAGGLLMYQLEHHRLPERLDQLKGLPIVPGDIEFVCPVSHQPYLYTPQGLRIASHPGVIVLRDAAPSHAGMRWAVFLLPPEQPGEPMVTKVIAVSEKQLKE
jgi:hypothetical protein